ncbi:Phage tail sheath protein FI [Rhodococcus wratislaviensis]|uniref:Phage tail sheath protein FI n=1 Tax=Rhodococcus wratislaviensis TaxID=44752 RepID=A0A402CKI0_RHOWR|nr:phage tail sheath C-terminal domain-containing protein [Rhodococcus wratislaviensis]GCE44113.1 Phage tail sheath protein FI [Rhodococcus wratislaviensis]
MPEYLAPGVYIEEIATGPVPIEGVSTSTAGLVGQTVRGPTEPRLVTSWLDFQRWYGGLADPDVLGSYLPFAAQGFFDNGGRRAYIARVHRSDAVSSTITLSTADADLVLTALGPGNLNDRLFAWVGPASRRNPSKPEEADPSRFRLLLLYYDAARNPLVDPLNPDNAVNPNRRDPDVVEDFDDLEVDPRGSDFVVGALRRSTLVTADFNPQTGPGLPDPTGFADGEHTYIAAANGDDGTAAMALNDFLGSPPTATSRGSGLHGIEAIDEISLLSTPDEGHANIPPAVRVSLKGEIVQQCERLKDRFGILQFTNDVGGGDPASVTPPASTSYAAVYYPWVRVLDPATSETYLVPPGGHVAGVYARTDIERGVHKAPANAIVRGIISADLPGNRGPLSVSVTKGQQDVLNPRGVNVIRDFRADRRGIQVWGARTLSPDAQWKYVNVRRLFIFLEESVEEGTQWVVFEPNDEPTWARVRRSISNFLTSVWRSGALQGGTAEEAFFVRCDHTTMTQDDIDNGRLICLVGVAPVKPAEFVIFRFSQKTIEAS